MHSLEMIRQSKLQASTNFRLGAAVEEGIEGQRHVQKLNQRSHDFCYHAASAIDFTVSPVPFQDCARFLLLN